MDLKKYWPLILIIALVVIYFAFKTNIDKWLGMAKGLSSPSWASCGKTFFAKLPDGKILSITTTDEGTTGHPIAAYYKNEVELNQDGVSKSGDPIKITKEEFDSMCQYMYNPPYAWYTEKPQTSTGEGHGRKMAMGGVVGVIGMSPSFGSGIGATSSNESDRINKKWDFYKYGVQQKGDIGTRLVGNLDIPQSLRGKVNVKIHLAGLTTPAYTHIISIPSTKEIMVQPFPIPINYTLTSGTVELV